MEKWLQLGLREQTSQACSEDGKQIEGETPIALTTAKHQESWTYTRPYFSPLANSLNEPLLHENRRRYPDTDPGTLKTHPFYRAETDLTFDNLPLLRPSVLYVFPQKSAIATPALQGQIMETTGIGKGGSGGVKAGKVKSVGFERGSHLVTFEKPDQCAEIVVGWLIEWFGEWRQDEQKEMEEGARGKSEMKGNRLVISREWHDRTKVWMDDFLKSKAKTKLLEKKSSRDTAIRKKRHFSLVFIDWPLWFWGFAWTALQRDWACNASRNGTSTHLHFGWI